MNGFKSWERCFAQSWSLGRKSELSRKLREIMWTFYWKMGIWRTAEESGRMFAFYLGRPILIVLRSCWQCHCYRALASPLNTTSLDTGYKFQRALHFELSILKYVSACRNYNCYMGWFPSCLSLVQTAGSLSPCSQVLFFCVCYYFCIFFCSQGNIILWPHSWVGLPEQFFLAPSEERRLGTTHL
jgi:hypothetical protein